jgi:heptosyltransferase II
MSWRLGQRPLRRVLVTRLRYLGDVVMSTVVLAALRDGDPGLELGYLCEETHAPALAGHPALARVHALRVVRRGSDARARADGPVAGAAGGVPRGAVGLVGELQRARYDAAIDLFFNPRSAWLLALAGIPERLAGPARNRGWLYTRQTDSAAVRARDGWDQVAPGGLGEHLARLAPLTHVETGLDFATWFVTRGQLAFPRLGARDGAAARAAASLRAAGVRRDGAPLVLAPGATWASKRWPAAHWRALGAALATEWPGPVVALSPPGGDAALAALAEVLPAAGGAVLPVLTLPAALDVLAAAGGLVTVDGGVMHAAVGLGVPTLALFGPTDPRLWFPYEGAGPFRVLATGPSCHPCDRHDCDAFVCLPDLSPAAVREAAGFLFAGARPLAPHREAPAPGTGGGPP